MVAGGLGTCVVTPSGNVRVYGVKDGHGVFCPVVPYNPNATALSSTDYFNIPELRDLLVFPSSSRLYSVVPEMHELDKERYTFRPK